MSGKTITIDAGDQLRRCVVFRIRGHDADTVILDAVEEAVIGIVHHTALRLVVQLYLAQ